MSPTRKNLAIRHRPVLLAGLWLIAGALLFVALIQSLTVSVAWWRNELPAMRAVDWLWVLLLPFLIGSYLRFFSVLRPDCRACLSEDHYMQSGPRRP